MTKYMLTQALFCNSIKPYTLTIAGQSGYVCNVQREDGSGSSFNVTMFIPATRKYITVHVRTID